mgnify:CR=1 FL=1
MNDVSKKAIEISESAELSISGQKYPKIFESDVTILFKKQNSI